MINDIVNAIMDEMKSLKGFKQVDYYEGHLESPEDLSDFIIVPPAIFLEAPQGAMTSEILDNSFEQDLRIFVITSKMKGIGTNSMYERLDCLREHFHDKMIVIGEATLYVYVTTWNRLGVFPGFCVYEFNLKVKV